MFVLCPLTPCTTGIFSLLYTSPKETGCFPESQVFLWQLCLNPRSLRSLPTELVRREQVGPRAVSSGCVHDCPGPQRPLLGSSRCACPRSLPGRNAALRTLL